MERHICIHRGPAPRVRVPSTAAAVVTMPPDKLTHASNTVERPLAASFSGLTKHSVVLHGRLTSITIQDELWAVLKLVAAGRDQMLKELVFEIDTKRRGESLSRAARTFALTQMALASSPPIASDNFEDATLVYGDSEP